MALGILAPSGIFTPGDVKYEAEELHAATLAVARDIFNNPDAYDEIFEIAWNTYVGLEKDFYARAESFTYWVDFADNSSRDQVLALERTFMDLKNRWDARRGGDSPLPDFTDVDSRRPPPLFPVTDQAVDEAGKVIEKPLKLLERIGWELIAAGAVIVTVVVGLAVYLHKNGDVDFNRVIARGAGVP